MKQANLRIGENGENLERVIKFTTNSAWHISETLNRVTQANVI